MKFKGDVSYSIDGVVKILLVAERAYGEMGRGKGGTVTSLMDGKHMEGSKHYDGEAVDLRTFFFSNAEKRIFKKKVQVGLGDDYDVILHSTHLHVEYDPK